MSSARRARRFPYSCRDATACACSRIFFDANTAAWWDQIWKQLLYL